MPRRGLVLSVRNAYESIESKCLPIFDFIFQCFLKIASHFSNEMKFRKLCSSRILFYALIRLYSLLFSVSDFLKRKTRSRLWRLLQRYSKGLAIKVLSQSSLWTFYYRGTVKVLSPSSIWRKQNPYRNLSTKGRINVGYINNNDIYEYIFL